ncbi:MAG: hypothetical protein RMJ45_05580 [Candidatus Calescibacterium sp.]|nr:hypothetical protein [Candidatus Calescibacterium sp.]
MKSTRGVRKIKVNNAEVRYALAEELLIYKFHRERNMEDLKSICPKTRI